jgi:malate/lactate dehydrogenase
MMMRVMERIAIVGAGELGAAIAARLAARDRVGELRLIDPAGGGSIAAGKTLDIRQSGPIEGFRGLMSADADVRASAGARVIVLADSAATSEEWQGEDALALVGRLWPLVEREETAIVCAGATQARLIARAIAERGIDPRRMCGSAPGALESAVRALVAAEADSSPVDVSLEVVGVPPGGAVVAWSNATVRGASVADVVPAHGLNAIASRLRALWPPGPYALASAAARVVEALAGGSLRRYTCFVALEGQRRGVAALPVRLGAGKIQAIVELSLSPHERVRLETAIDQWR